MLVQILNPKHQPLNNIKLSNVKAPNRDAFAQSSKFENLNFGVCLGFRY